jgi:hypothetical protein
MENGGPGSHGYVCGLCLKSQGGLLQNVESKNQEGFQDTQRGISYRMFFKTPKKQVIKKQVLNNADLESVQQDKRGCTINADFVAGNNGASTAESVDSSMPDTPMVNSNPGQSKYGWAYRCTMHYDPATGCTIGAEATTLANYYQCLKDTDSKTEFANVGAGIGGGFENTMELKPMKYKEAINGPDGKAWAKEIENKHDVWSKMMHWNQ